MTVLRVASVKEMSSSINWTLPEYVGETIPQHARIIFIVVGILYIMAGLVGNVVIVLTVVTNKTMHNPHYYFIINLALADLTIIAYIVPWTVLGLILDYYPVHSHSLCVFNGMVIVIGYLASLMTLMVISINRYLNICHRELFAAIFSRKILFSIIYCCIIWCTAFLCSLPPLVGWSRFHYDVKTHYCGYDRTYSFYYTLFLMLTAIGIPVGIVLACNIGLWKFIRQASMRIHSFKASQRAESGVASVSSAISASAGSSIGQDELVEHQADPSGHTPLTVHPTALLALPHSGSRSVKDNRVHPQEQQSVHSVPSLAKVKEATSSERAQAPHKKLVTPEELSLIKSLFVVFVCFAVLMSPYMMACLLDTSNQWPSVVHLTCTYTSFTNTCINWVVYGVMNKNFKRAYKKLLCCMVGKTKNNSTSRSHLQDGRSET
ncbi:hypothetical protein Btru_050844 [Bulinus truncatus]|nr:hypothetical protein Btru_050844 [Bulinus truncatus]